MPTQPNKAHTPGPWKVVNNSWSDTTIVAPGFDHGICLLDINHATEESQEADEAQMAANAALIAAAPDLLEALRALECHVSANLSSDYPAGIDVEFDEPFKKARAAIARATGASRE
jgi:hypothetical protein